MIYMDEINVPIRRYHTGKKVNKTWRVHTGLMRRLDQEAERLGMKSSDLILLVLDLWCQQQDKQQGNGV